MDEIGAVCFGETHTDLACLFQTQHPPGNKCSAYDASAIRGYLYCADTFFAVLKNVEIVVKPILKAWVPERQLQRFTAFEEKRIEDVKLHFYGSSNNSSPACANILEAVPAPDGRNLIETLADENYAKLP